MRLNRNAAERRAGRRCCRERLRAARLGIIQTVEPIVSLFLISRQAKPAFLIADREKLLGLFRTVGGRLLIPVHRLAFVGFHAESAVIHQREIELRLCFFLFGVWGFVGVGLLVFFCFCGVFGVAIRFCAHRCLCVFCFFFVFCLFCLFL